MGFKTDLQSNNTDLQTILDAINELPEAGEGGIDTSGDTVTPETLVTGYTAHDASGEPITGVNPYELESTNATVEEQADLIVQIQTALEGKAGGGGSSGGGSVETCTVNISTSKTTIQKIAYGKMVNGVPTLINEAGLSDTSKTLTDVPLNSLVYLRSQYAATASTGTNIEFIMMDNACVFGITGTNATVTLARGSVVSPD